MHPHQVNVIVSSRYAPMSCVYPGIRDASWSGMRPSRSAWRIQCNRIHMPYICCFPVVPCNYLHCHLFARLQPPRISLIHFKIIISTSSLIPLQQQADATQNIVVLNWKSLESEISGDDSVVNNLNCGGLIRGLFVNWKDYVAQQSSWDFVPLGKTAISGDRLAGITKPESTEIGLMFKNSAFLWNVTNLRVIYKWKCARFGASQATLTP